jgi:beta-lactamase superfamily II metal-dependent hydrolase
LPTGALRRRCSTPYAALPAAAQHRKTFQELHGLLPSGGFSTIIPEFWTWRMSASARITIASIREVAMRKSMLVPVAVLATLWGQAAVVVAQPRTTLDIYVVDVEGGNAVLFSAPTGESLLIDTGNVAPDAAIRDAERIMAAAKEARLSQIDNLITTHWHGDHFGGMAELAKRIPIRHFIDMARPFNLLLPSRPIIKEAGIKAQ